MREQMLIAAAEKAMKGAYCPYSSFAVGAALLCADGTVFCGCNIENASYPATICAERTAFSAAITAGKRTFTAIAVVGGKDGDITEFCPPCGICRQVMSEFCDADFSVWLFDGKVEKQLRLGELLPEAFGGVKSCE